MMADEKKVLRLLKTARGQLDGIIRMVDENRYCIDIAQQVAATEAILGRVNKEILSAHLKHCVQNADDEQARAEKIDEFVLTLDRLLK
ncbi:MAG: metal-sensing transcriptional repressor [Oscillospiraceae bacterium]|nr:metal-sensing transcriptional repressor [Oscillospiraceae bacterium]